MKYQEKGRKHEEKPQGVVKLKDLSTSAYLRLLAMHEEANEAAKIMLTHPDAYPDFFLETPTTNFHEYIGPPEKRAEVENILVRSSRMALVERFRLEAGDKYGDFFVDSPRNGPPFHEKFLDKGPPKDEWLDDVSSRAQALSRLNVVQAYLRMLEKG